MLGALTINLWTYIFEFLEQKDCFGVEIVCKRFCQILRENDKFWSRECLNKYISFDLELYSEIYQSEDYKTNLKNGLSWAAKKQWRSLLREGVQLEKQFFSLIKQISTKEETEAFMRDFFQTLKEPNLPLASLKRETFVKSTQTAFQNKLSEVLYEDCLFQAKKLNFIESSKAVIDKLGESEIGLLNEMALDEKSSFMKARWYINQKNDKLLDEAISNEKQKNDMALESYNHNNSQGISNVSTEDSLIANSNHSYLLSMYDCLRDTLIHFCHLVSEYLSCLDNFYDLLAEYTTRWKVYVCSMLEIEKTFSTFADLFNKAYGAVFEGYPGFPKFSIWRLMTKIWINQVYENQKVKSSLNAAFQQVLLNHRDKNVKQIICNDQIFEFSDIQDPTIPKCLYINFHLDQEVNLQGNCTHHAYFDGNFQGEKELLSEYIQAILDLSLNEVSIHFFDCTELPVNCFYQELEELFLSNTQNYYECHQPLFKKCPEYFCAFVKADCSLFAESFVERTKHKFMSLQVNHGLQFMRNLIRDQIENFSLLDLESFCINFISEENELEIFIDENIKHVLEEVCSKNEMEEETFYEQMKNSSEMIHKIKLHAQKKHKLLRNDFGHLMKRLNELNEMIENDKYIKYNNCEKNIPFELGDTDELFYSLDKDLNVALLEKLHDDYLLMTKDEMKIESESNMMLPEEENGQMMNLNLDQDFLEDIDLMNLDNLQLRRTLY